MLEGTQIPCTCPAELNQCLFEVNTKEPRLNLGPTTIVSSFELKSDLDMCLDLHLNEFEMDFSLPTKRLNCFVAPANKLNVLPENIDFSEMLSFQNHSNSYTMEQSVGDSYNTINANLDNKEVNFIQQIPDVVEENSVSDIIEEVPKIPHNFGLLSRILNDAQAVKRSIVNAKCKRNKLRSQKLINSKLLIGFFQAIMSESQQNLIGTSSESLKSQCSDYISYMKILSVNSKSNESLAPKKEEHIDTCESLEELSLTVEKKIENNTTIEAQQFPKETEKDTSLNLKEKEELKTSTEKIKYKESHKLIELTIKQDEKLESNKENSLQTFSAIVDAKAIQKSGIQIFRKPAKLFVFDSLREWKKKGEGQIGIWKLDQSDSGIYYVLLWDKSSEKLLIHMRVDRKWGLDYLANSTNSCRWSHFNYANCPEGVRERLACRFRDSDVAAQFVGIVAKCIANSRLHFK